MDNDDFSKYKLVVIQEFKKNKSIFKYTNGNRKLNIEYSVDTLNKMTDCRDGNLVMLRNTIMCLIKDLNKNISKFSIAKVFNKNHATFINSEKIVSNELQTNKEYVEFYKRCKDTILFSGFVNYKCDKSFTIALSIVRKYGEKAVKELIDRFY